MNQEPPPFAVLFPSRNPLNATGIVKTIPADFKVTETNPSIDFSGAGEHLWLWVEKTDTNTDWVAKQLAHICQVSQHQVGYAGLKDRHAITQQWFSVQLPKISHVHHIQSALPDEIKILSTQWHHKKIKTGFLKGNRFELRLRNIKGDKQSIEENIQNIVSHGVPNYFGPQRFGHNLHNITKVKDFFSGQFKTRNKKLKSLLISTARSHIFNNILAARINNNTWHQIIDGDIMQLNNSHSWFHASEATQSELTQRLADKDIHISAALWGEDEVQSQAKCAAFEQSIATQTPEYFPGFEKFRVKQDRRAIRLCPQALQHQWLDRDLILSFELPAGAYATAVLAEILKVNESK